MIHNWVDWVFLVTFAIAIFRGWRAGFLVTIFGAIGFIGGGLGGLYFGLHYLHRWSGGVAKFALLLLVISVGSWCEPCQEEIPHFLDLAKTHKVAIVGVDVEEASIGVGRAFVAKKGMGWPILFDVNSVTRGLFGMGVPVTWFIDAHGKVTYKQIGIIHSDAVLNAEVTKYLGIKF